MESVTKWNNYTNTAYVKPPRELMREREHALALVRLNEQAKTLNNFVLYKLREYNQLTSIGYMASSILHDLSNPLSVVLLNLEVLQDKLKDDETVNLALLGAQEMAKTIKTYNQSLRNDKSTSDINVYTELTGIKKMLEYTLRAENIFFEINGDKNIQINGNRTKFTQVILNLVTNSIDALKKSAKKEKKVEISCESTNSKKQAQTSIKVLDNGCGIPEPYIKRIFDPFYTTKKDGKGLEKNLGLGLFICKKIVEDDFGGSLKIDSKVKKYTRVLIQIPAKLV